MRAEVIIACRGELPANLERTVANIDASRSSDDGVCLVYDGAGQRDYRLPAHVRVEEPWLMARGPGQCRHWGITTSSADVVILVDAHMEFPANWIDLICAHLKKNKNHVTCAHMISLSRDWEPTGTPYAGAYIALKGQGVGNQYVGLGARWNATPMDSGLVGAPMGACYGFTRKFYDMMGQPLRILEAWGGDEELLGICSWLSGGGTWLLPIVCGHMYAAPHMPRAAADVKDHEIEIWANRLAIIDAVVSDAAQSEALRAWTRRSFIEWDRVEQTLSVRAMSISSLKECLARKRRKWSGYVDAGWAREMTDAERALALTSTTINDTARRPVGASPRTTAPSVVTVRPPVCPACDGYNTLKRQEGMRRRGALLEAHAKCTRCGHKVKLRAIAR